MKKHIITIIIIAILLFGLVGGFWYFNQNKDSDVMYQEDAIEYFELLQGEQFGVVDKKGNMIIEPIYSNVFIPRKSVDVFFCYEDNLNYKILNKTGNELFENYEEVTPIIGSLFERYEYRNLLRYKEEDKYGLMDTAGVRKTRAMYDKIEALDDDTGIYKVTVDGKIGLLKADAKVLIPPKYENITAKSTFHYDKDEFNVGYELRDLVNSEPKYGFASSNGKILLKPKFENIIKTDMSSDDYYLIVQENGRKGLFKNNKRIIKSKYQEIALGTNLAIVKEYQRYGLYSLDGRELISPRFDEFKLFGKYVTFVDGENEYTYDGIGNKIAGSEFLIISDVSNKNYLIVADKNNKMTLIIDGVSLPERYDNLRYVFEDYFIFEENKKMGIFEVNKGVVIPAEFDVINQIYGTNIIKAIKGNDVSLYNRELYLINFAKKFTEEKIKDKSLLFIYNSTDAKYLDFDGHEIENINILDKKYYAKKEGSKWGFVDKDQNIVLRPKYDMVTEFNDYGFASVRVGKKWGVIDETLEEVIKPQYEFENRESMPKFINKFLLEENFKGLVIDIDKSEVTKVSN